MKKKAIQTDKGPKAVGAYSQAILVGNFLFLSGQIPIDPKTGEVVKGDIAAQTKRVMENIKGILESQGLGMDDIVKATVFLKDIEEFSRFNEIYATYFRFAPPARSTVEVARIVKDVKIEVEVMATTRD